jgi:hypothetical protein
MRERRTAARTAARRGAAALLLLGVMIAVLIVLNAVLSAPRLAAVEEGQVGEIGTPHPPRMRRPKAGEYDDDEEGVDKEEDKEEDNDEGNDKGSEDDEDDEEGGEDDENDEKDEKDEKDEEEEDTQDGTVEALGVEWRLTPLGTGAYSKIQVRSAWVSLTGPTALRRQGLDTIHISAPFGFDTKEARDYPLGSPSWFLNVWGGPGMRQRVIHINPRAGSNSVALNHFVDGRWGQQRDAKLPAAWDAAHIAVPFELALTLGEGAWHVRLNGASLDSLTYARHGDIGDTMELQLYGLKDPVVKMRRGED